ncbi:hypothetical protein PIB30_079419 [Stylosanthes scabra]|uniref:Uncharacterized protein n=1 Tax=Stylosanthes scabra TaxID=79078 RepID=A0ABU6YQ80_9FABA|nr:hypothetical protein [Stylosanthes scabra]
MKKSSAEDCKGSDEPQKSQAKLSLQPSIADPRNSFELGFTHPMISVKYPYMSQIYGLFSAYAPQISVAFSSVYCNDWISFMQHKKSIAGEVVFLAGSMDILKDKA